MGYHLRSRRRRATTPPTRGTATARTPASGHRPTVWRPRISRTATTRPAAARARTARWAPLRRCPRPRAAQRTIRLNDAHRSPAESPALERIAPDRTVGKRDTTKETHAK